MARGELVPDDVVVAIVADRIGEPDAKKGFILDGFPRTVPQAVALDRMLKDKGLKLDAVLELKVDANILHKRIASRIGEATARGEALRADDDPEVLKRRLEAYREQTAPLVDYYRWQGSLRTIDGMEPIPEVARAIDQALAAPKAKKAAGGVAKPGKASKSRANGRPPKVEVAKAKVGKPKTAAGKAAKGAKSKKAAVRKVAAGRSKRAARKSSKGKR
jgi:adenylate kinase